MSNYTVIQGKDKAAGDFVFNLNSESGRGVATEQGFGHVHKHWYKQTQSYDEGLAALEAGKAETEDFRCQLNDFTPSVDKDGVFCMEYKDGRQFIPTEHALNQLGTLFGCGTWYVKQLATSKIPGAAQQLASDLKFWRKGLPEVKPQLFRTRKDGSLRAVLGGGPKGYAIIDNRWFLEVIREVIPGGRLSHFSKGDSDTIYGNVLIPDTIRAESDSDYGGMVSLGNSEIGIRSIKNLPSVFRAICMNGCIWGQEFGKAFKQVHKGKIDLVRLKANIRECIEAQIPLLPSGIDRLISLQGFTTNVDVKPLVAQIAIDNNIAPSNASKVLAAYAQEIKATGHEKSLFAVVNAFTRAGQELDGNLWLQFDEIGGELAFLDNSDWISLTRRAANLKAEKVDDAFSVSA